MPDGGNQEIAQPNIAEASEALTNDPQLILQQIRKDQDSGNVGHVLAGILRLDELGEAEKNVPELQKLGEKGAIWNQTMTNLFNADTEGDGGFARGNLRLAELLGMDKEPYVAELLEEFNKKYPSPSSQKTAEEPVIAQEAPPEEEVTEELTPEEKQSKIDIKYLQSIRTQEDIDMESERLESKYPDIRQSLTDFLLVRNRLKKELSKDLDDPLKVDENVDTVIAEAVKDISIGQNADPNYLKIPGQEFPKIIAAKIEEELLEALPGAETNKKDPEEEKVEEVVSKNSFIIRILGGQSLKEVVGDDLMKRATNYLWNHKAEILIPGTIGFAVKAGWRTAITGAGGFLGLLAGGFVAGGLTGAAKEYIKQRKNIDVEDAGRTLLISGLKTEFRKIKASDKKAIVHASVKGACFGALSAVIGAGFAEVATTFGEHFVVAQEKAFGGLVASGKHLQEQVSMPAKQIASEMREQISTRVPGSEQWMQEHIPGFGRPGIETSTPGVSAVASLKAVPNISKVVQLEPNRLLPNSSDSIVLKSGSNPWNEMETYLKNNLGDRKLSGEEIKGAVTRLLADNHIPDATKIAAGTKLDLHGVNEYLKSTVGGEPSFSATLSIMPPKVPLPSGSNPWEETHAYLYNAFGGHDPSNEEVMEITKMVCNKSSIAVPSWGIPGGVDDRHIPVGYNLIFDDEVKKKIAGLLIKK